ncbi:MAG: LytTR family transcriptional regulator [Bacteroidales bacterium]|nr:LytTR family transcriptional regulator [Bacteroidales bacterium]
MEEGAKKYIPSYLRERYQLLGTVTFAALFSVLFLLVSIPFSNNAWFRLGNSTFFGFTALFASISLAIVIVSKVTMYKTRNILPMTYWGYSAWCLSEIVLITVLYTIFTVTIAQPEDQNGIAIFFHALVYTFVCLGVPYIIAGMFFTIIDQNRTIRLMNMQDVVTDETPAETAAPVQKFTLFDNNGVLKLSVSSANLYYVEADDNYIKVWYADQQGALQTYMLRCRLKTVEESFAGSDLIRCHRKFIVNMQKVKLLQKVGSVYEITLDNEAIAPIPVTKTYIGNVLERFRESYS